MKVVRIPLMNKSIDIEKVKLKLRTFASERDWDQFHSPKNLACALNVEASELLEIFQWMNEKDSREIMKDPIMAQKVKDEMSDIFYYLARLSDILEIDLEEEFFNKMPKNELKYPIELAKGNSKKYNELK